MGPIAITPVTVMDAPMMPVVAASNTEINTTANANPPRTRAINSRNAITHDGNSIINGCLNGLYFVGSNIIRRLDNNKELIEIKAPITDIRTLCLEFALDYCMCIHQLFAEAVKNGYKDRKGDISELKQAINESNITPPYIRSIEFDWEEMAKIVNNTEPKTVENIMHNLSEVIDYCKLKTQETAAL